MIRSVEITGFQLSIVYLRVVRQAIWELRLTENRETVYNLGTNNVRLGHLRMKKNKSVPSIKTQLAKIVVIQVAILLAFLVLFTVKRNGSDAAYMAQYQCTDLPVIIK